MHVILSEIYILKLFIFQKNNIKRPNANYNLIFCKHAIYRKYKYVFLKKKNCNFYQFYKESTYPVWKYFSFLISAAAIPFFTEDIIRYVLVIGNILYFLTIFATDWQKQKRSLSYKCNTNVNWYVDISLFFFIMILSQTHVRSMDIFWTKEKHYDRQNIKSVFPRFAGMRSSLSSLRERCTGWSRIECGIGKMRFADLYDKRHDEWLTGMTADTTEQLIENSILRTNSCELMDPSARPMDATDGEATT